MQIQFTGMAMERWTSALSYLTERNPAAALRLFNKVQAKHRSEDFVRSRCSARRCESINIFPSAKSSSRRNDSCTSSKPTDAP